MPSPEELDKIQKENLTYEQIEKDKERVKNPEIRKNLFKEIQDNSGNIEDQCRIIRSQSVDIIDTSPLSQRERIECGFTGVGDIRLKMKFVIENISFIKGNLSRARRMEEKKSNE